MGIFPGFGGWISQNIQQPKESENDKSKPVREKKTHEDRDEMKKQLKLWRDANKKEKYHEAPPKLNVKTEHKLDSFSSMRMDFTLGLPPQAAFDVLTNQDNKTFSRVIKGRPLLKTISRKVTPEIGLGGNPVLEMDKELSWNFLFFSGTIPLRLYVLEDSKKLTIYFWKRRKGMDYMETFKFSYNMEPMYVDAERLCKNKKPKSIEEYRKCSGGKGLIATKVRVKQIIRPSFPWNLPLLSSCVRRFAVETTKKVAEDLQKRAGDIRRS